jgi:membrane protein implicated in regulation of membrane protease activity
VSFDPPINEVAFAPDGIQPNAKVYIKISGVWWAVTSKHCVDAGMKVLVIAREGLTLVVHPLGQGLALQR